MGWIEGRWGGLCCYKWFVCLVVGEKEYWILMNILIE